MKIGSSGSRNAPPQRVRTGTRAAGLGGVALATKTLHRHPAHSIHTGARASPIADNPERPCAHCAAAKNAKNLAPVSDKPFLGSPSNCLREQEQGISSSVCLGPIRQAPLVRSWRSEPARRLGLKIHLIVGSIVSHSFLVWIW